MSGLGSLAQTASNGMTVTINDDGSVNFDAPEPPARKARSTNFNQNLAETLDDGALDTIANDYLDGVAADILSRSEFIQNYNRGIDLLGLKLDEPSTVRGNRTSISKIKNPSLLKACMRSQSMSRGQLLPAKGPCKVQTISGDDEKTDDLALHFEQDFNYFLTKVDKSYYPDMDRALFYRAFGGSVYKKVYRDPILGRPTSRFVSLDSFIVSEDATDIHDALRKTNELIYSPVQVKQMQISGGWLDIPLGQPMMNVNPARRKVLQSQGLSAATTRSQDISHTIYEGYWTFDPADYGFDEPKAPEGMPLPYKVVIDKDSRKVLALHRNWKKGDEMFRERQVFVKYGLVPGLGFLDYGFLHLIGNQTRVLTAIWQILVDKGMLGNFPGGLKAKGVRTATNELNPSLGEWAEVDIGSIDDIRKALMAMPYGEISSIFIDLMKEIQADVDALSGTLDIPTNGGQNVPVGTILAVIEQQAQDLTAVQQRDHRAQEEELRLIRDLFLEYPEDLKHLLRKGSNRSYADLLEEIEDLDLVPASDPNIPSQAHRILINQFLVDMAKAAPDLFGSNLQKVADRALRGIGINDAKDLLAPRAEFLQALNASRQGGKGGKANPGAAAAAKAQAEAPFKQAELQLEGQRIQLEQQENQREAAEAVTDAQNKQNEQQVEAQKNADELELEKNKLASQHVLGLANAAGDAAANSANDPQAAADLEKTKAQAFSAIGTGAMGLAKAQESVQQGARDAEAIENGETPPSETKDASLAGPAPSAAPKPAAKPLKKTGTASKTPKAKGAGK